MISLSKSKSLKLHLERLETRTLLAGDLVISEFLASNTGDFVDGNGVSSDWIEIHNLGDQPIDLSKDFFLTDDASNPTKWPFPQLAKSILDAGDFLVVFASGNGVPDLGGHLHTNFSLDAAGEYLALTSSANGNVHIHTEFGSPETDYPNQRPNISLGPVTEIIDLVGTDTPLNVWVPASNEPFPLDELWKGQNESEFQRLGGTNNWQQGTSPVGFTSTSDVETYEDVILSEESLVSYYSFESDTAGAGNRIHDIANQNPHHGTVVGQAAIANGVSGPGSRSLLLDGDGFVSLGAVADFQLFPSDEATIEAWLKPTYTERRDNPAWFGTQTLIGDGRDRYSMRLYGDYSGVLKTSSTGGTHAAEVPLQRDEWVHVAGVFKSGRTVFYVNGQAVGTVGTGTTGSTNRPTLSFLGSGGRATSNDHFIGQIDDVAVYDSALNLKTLREHIEAQQTYASLTFGVDLNDQMAGQTTSAFIRAPFEMRDIHNSASLRMDITYEDGFIAYINGVEVARRNVIGNASQARSALAEMRQEQIPFNVGPDTLRQGMNVLAIHGFSGGIQDPQFFISTNLFATVYQDDETQYFPTPSPGTANLAGIDGYVDDVLLSRSHGYFETPFILELHGQTPGATIVYTTNGSEPTLSNGTKLPAISSDRPVSHAVAITSTTTLRVKAFREDLEPSRTVSQTYLFPSDVIRQPHMDREVIGPNDRYLGKYAATIEDDLTAIPTLSLTMNQSDLFGSNGIYTNHQRRGFQWEKPVSFELFDASDKPCLQINAGIRLHGADGRSHAKKPFRIYFRGLYGTASMDFRLFPDANQTRFDRLILRPGAHDSFTSPHGRQSKEGLLVRDSFVRRSHQEMGGLSPHGRRVHLYLNGTYWGMYEIVERPDRFFFASHLGGHPDDYDVIKTSAKNNPPPVATDGNLHAWNAMMAIVNRGVQTPNAYQQLQQHLDVDDFIDYMILLQFAGEADWLAGDLSTNWYASRHRNGGRFRFHTWDSEQNLGHDGSGRSMQIDKNFTVNLRAPNSPAKIYNQLQKNQEFRRRFGDRVQKHLFGDGTLSPAKNLTRWANVLDEVDEAIVAESARWGDQHNSQPRTRDETWQPEIDWITNVFFSQRNAVLVSQYQRIGLYPNVESPEFLVNGKPQYGGLFEPGDKLSIDTDTINGSVIYTLDGSDPIDADGAFSSSVKITWPLVLDEDVTVKARRYRNGEWSAMSEATFLEIPLAANADNLRISEVHYHPAVPSPIEIAKGFADDDDFEFIELVNVASDPIDLTDVNLRQIIRDNGAEGVEFRFLDAGIVRLTSGQRVVVVEDVAAFRERYGDAPLVAGQWSGGLSNRSETITLGNSREVFQQVTYQDAWYDPTDGLGWSLEARHETASDPNLWNAAQGWQASAQHGGSPGQAPGLVGDVTGDNVVSVADIDALYAAIRQYDDDLQFDLNRDLAVDQGDVDMLVNDVLQISYGDVNLDGVFNSDDFVLLFQLPEYNDNISGNSTWTDGDWNGDGEFDTRDLVFVFQLGVYQHD